jgi:hypothetical protein
MTKAKHKKAPAKVYVLKGGIYLTKCRCGRIGRAATPKGGKNPFGPSLSPVDQLLRAGCNVDEAKHFKLFYLERQHPCA